MKEIYGWLLLLALLCLVGLMLRHSDIRPMKVVEPTYRLIHRHIFRDLRKQMSLKPFAKFKILRNLKN